MSEDDFLWPPESFEENEDPALAQKLQHTVDIIFAQLRRMQDAADAAAASGGGSAHEILSATHSDATVAAAANGDLLVRAGGFWVRLPIGALGQALIQVLGVPTWSNDGHALLIDASNIDTGVLAAARFLHDLLSAAHQDTIPATAVLGDMVVAQAAVGADVDAHWLDGLPYDEIPNVLDGGDEVYWQDGLPAVGLEVSGEVRWQRKANSVTAGYVWTAGATGPDWQPSATAGALAQVYRASNLSITPFAAPTLLPLETVVVDASGFWASGAPTRFTVPNGLAGKYVVVAQISWNVTFVGNGWVAIFKNGVNVAESVLPGGAAVATRAPLQAVYVAQLAVGDYLEMSVYLEAGGAIQVLGGAAKTFLQLLKVA